MESAEGKWDRADGIGWNDADFGDDGGYGCWRGEVVQRIENFQIGPIVQL